MVIKKKKGVVSTTKDHVSGVWAMLTTCVSEIMNLHIKDKFFSFVMLSMEFCHHNNST